MVWVIVRNNFPLVYKMIDDRLPTIALLGAGNMAQSLIGGLVTSGISCGNLWISDPDREIAARVKQRFSVQVAETNVQAVTLADVVVLAVKPQILGSVAEEIQSAVQQRKPLVLSVAAGIKIADLDRWLGGNTAIVRAMPNTPALVQSAATALCGNSLVSEEQHDLAESILRAVGVTLWLEDESLIDIVTSLSGSGPAYHFLMMEAMEEAAVQMGLPVEAARLLTLETAFGAAKMALESDETVGYLRQRVTSPGGTTEQAIRVFEENHFKEILLKAMSAARNRSVDLAQQLGHSSSKV